MPLNQKEKAKLQAIVSAAKKLGASSQDKTYVDKTSMKGGYNADWDSEELEERVMGSKKKKNPKAPYYTDNDGRVWSNFDMKRTGK